MDDSFSGESGNTPEKVREALEGYAVYLLEMATEAQVTGGDIDVPDWDEYLIEYLLAELDG